MLYDEDDDQNDGHHSQANAYADTNALTET